MSGSEILEEIVEKKGGKIWVAKRIGKRIAYIDGLKAGNELYLEPAIIYDDGVYVVFAEGVKVDGWVNEKLKELVKLLRECEKE